MKKLYTIIIFFIFIISSSIAQNGIIRGTVIEDATGEPLFGVTVVVKGTTNGGVTDFDGKFEIKTAPGTYDIQASFVSFSPITVSGVTVNTGDVTVIDQIRLKEDVQQLEEVVITAEAVKTTEQALLTIKKKSVNVLDGISAATFKQVGASDAASAVTKVPGVSVQGGKYVFVRGLGDRYTKTVLNGLEIPGLDPDRNTLQLDIFPTNVLDNIIVLKSFTADLPADFTGGIVNVETKDFPDEKTMNISVGVGINPDFHFQDNYTDYEGGNTDFLGFDDGTRQLPFSGDTEFLQAGAAPNLDESQVLTDLTRQFNPTFGTSRGTSNPNFNLSFSAGDQFTKDKYTIGYNAAVTYRNQTTFYDSAENYSIWLKNSADPSITELEQDRSRRGVEGTNNVLLGGLGGIAIKTNRSKYQLTALHVQNGESVANVYDEINIIRNDNRSTRDVLAYGERALTNVLLSGEHYLDRNKLTIEWKLSPTFSRVDDLDVRLVPFTRSEEGALDIERSEGGSPVRLWRFLDEQNYTGRIDFTKEFEFNGLDSKLKFGASETFKQRDFSITNFDFVIIDEDNVTLNGDPNALLSDENIFVGLDTDDDGFVDVRRGTAVQPDALDLSNTFEGSINNFAAYISGELPISEKLKTILGVRVEYYVQRYTGGDQDFFNSNGAQGNFLDDEKVIESVKPFPTASFIYGYNENSNLRFSYSRTIARPSFKEQSIAQIVDPISGTTFIGGIQFDPDTGERTDLVETDINNIDLRWETFFKRGQTVAISGFFKTFQNPLEIEVFNAQEPDAFTARNNGDAIVFGAELEVRKNFDFVSPALEDFAINLNASYIESRLDISEQERVGRQGQAREGEIIDDTRQLQGQSPYLINVGLTYGNFDKGWDTGLFYNVQGPALAVVGTGITPDLFNVPFNDLRFSIKKSFGAELQSSLRFRISNILNDRIETRFESFGSQDRISSSRAPGQTYSLSYSYSFN
ncbi:MAG: TonB-dependent receptor [Bacteroidota bacterium]